MDQKLVLIDSIALLYREAENPGTGVDNSSLVNTIVDKVKVSESMAEMNTGKDSVLALRNTIHWMMDQGTASPFDREDLLQRIRVNVADETYLLDAVEAATKPLPEPDDILDNISRIETKLRVELNKENLKSLVKQAYMDTHFNESSLNWSTFPDQMTNSLEPFANSMAGNQVMDEMVSEINLDNIASVAEALAKARNINSSEGVMRLGWQGWNTMLGQVGGFRRGDMICVGALQHNFKSGALLHLPRQVAMYNQPYMFNKTKKPLILHLSLENAAEDNMMIMYKWLKENDLCEEFDVRDPDLDLEEAARYVQEKLQVNGYNFKFLRYDPSEFTFSKLQQLIRQYEKEYEIHLLSIDYLNMMSKEGCTGGTDSAIIRDLFRRVRNFCSPKGITVLTAHQLSGDAKALLRMGCDSLVKEVANKGYWDDCKKIDQELDLEIIIHLERPGDGTTYLTAMRGKHRMPFITPEKDLYQVYKFAPVGAIPDDVNGESAALKKVGLGAVGEGDMLWDNAA